MEDLEKFTNRIKRQLENLDTLQLDQIYRDHAKATEYTKKGFKDISIEELNGRTIEDITYEIQAAAKKLIRERSGGQS